jgi:hypothetical protein
MLHDCSPLNWLIPSGLMLCKATSTQLLGVFAEVEMLQSHGLRSLFCGDAVVMLISRVSAWPHFQERSDSVCFGYVLLWNHNLPAVFGITLFRKRGLCALCGV